MYERFFGFNERPFELTPNPRYLVLTDAHREAISNIEYGISSRKGITLLIGEAGSGKTTVIRTVAERQGPKGYCVHLQNPAFTRPELIEMLAAQFNLSDRARGSKAALLLELEVLLRRRHAANETTVLIVDEAQSVPLELLEEIRLLANFERDDEKLLSVVLAGQPEFARRLDGPSLGQFKQRITLWCELCRLTLEETAAYMLSRIRAAGGAGPLVFTREAVTLIHSAAKGIPRTINVIADNSLLTALAADQRLVNSQIVRQVCRDFHINRGGHLAEDDSGASPGSSISGAGKGLSGARNPLPTEPDRTAEPVTDRVPSMFARVLRRYSS